MLLASGGMAAFHVTLQNLLRATLPPPAGAQLRRGTLRSVLRRPRPFYYQEATMMRSPLTKYEANAVALSLLAVLSLLGSHGRTIRICRTTVRGVELPCRPSGHSRSTRGADGVSSNGAAAAADVCGVGVFALPAGRGAVPVDGRWTVEVRAADLPTTLRLGRVEVSCEGYDYADDPYVLKDSCALTYTLLPSKTGRTIRGERTAPSIKLDGGSVFQASILGYPRNDRVRILAVC